MNDNKLYKIEKPSELPTSIDDYKRQNYLLEIIPLLHLGFDGVKLGNWNELNTEHPYILAGSIVEFMGDLYEAKNDIFFDEDTSTQFTTRYIYFWRRNDDTSHINAALSSSGITFPTYNPSLRGFYEDTYGIAYNKYLRIHFKFENGEYRSKKYWDKDDVNRTAGGGGALKKYTKVYTIPGTFYFEYPMNAESVVFHIMGAGGGGGGFNWKYYTAKVGSKSEILIGSTEITSCDGGGPGGDAAGTAWVGIAGQGGLVSGRGSLYNGSSASGYRGGTPRDVVNASGGNGGDGRTSSGTVPNAGGGGSGACAIVEVLRSELETSNRVTVVIGKGGDASPHAKHNYLAPPKAGVNGSVYVEWYE